MPRYIAKRHIHIGGALAFAAGKPVPDGHVERFGLLDDGIEGPAVIEVDDDGVGDRPDLAEASPDNTPATVTPAQRLLYGDPDDEPAPADDEPTADDATESAAQEPAEPANQPAAAKAKTATRSKPATGSPTTTEPVTEA